MPVLDRAGQEAFWDRQVSGYDQADMTLDNEGELDLVHALCGEFCQLGYRAEDVVTLGGAVGSRDPKIVMDALRESGQLPSHIYFNDLSELMTRQALKTSLEPYLESGTKVSALSGPIHEVGDQIPHMPRRVIIGVYRDEAFVTANPAQGYQFSGFEEYRRNAERIGTHLVIEPVHIGGDGYTSTNARVFASINDHADATDLLFSRISGYINTVVGDALRVTGLHKGYSGFFLSHWFSERGIRCLVAHCFDPERISAMSVRRCAKGFVLCIDPVEPPRGIVTVLNNVIGNILPDEQRPTLATINRISR